MKLNLYIVLLGILVSQIYSERIRSKLHNKKKDDPPKAEGPTAAVKSSEAKPLDVTFEGL